MKIYNAIQYYNEQEHFRFRFDYLRNVVDVFIVCEGSHTHSGIKKSFRFKEDFFNLGYTNQDWEEKIIYSEVHFPEILLLPHKSGWDREAFQRNYLQFLCSSISLENESVIFFQDADEFLDPNVLFKYKTGELALPQTPERVYQDMYYYNTTCKAGIPHTTSILVPGVYLNSQFLIDKATKGYIPWSNIKNGWHFSFFMSEDLIIDKLKAYSHQEFNTDYYIDKSRIQDRMLKGQDLFDRPNELTHQFKYIAPESNTYLPTGIENYFKYKT